MKHLKSFSQLNRTHSHRKALYRNMVEALFSNERIKTTKIKAKEIRRIAEKLITKAKEKTLHNIRVVNKIIKDKKILNKLFEEIAPRYIERMGGYTRIIKLNSRKGDGADMAYLELIEEQSDSGIKKKKKKIKKADLKQNKSEQKVEEKEEKKEEPKVKDKKVKDKNLEEKKNKNDKKEKQSTEIDIKEKKEETEKTLVEDDTVKTIIKDDVAEETEKTIIKDDSEK